MIFYYVRHGQPIYEPDNLTEQGKEQAKALAKRFAVYGLDEIYCSTSKRAMLTAQPTADALKKEVTYLDWTNEHYAWLALCKIDENNVRRWAFGCPEYIEKFRREDVLCLGRKWYTHECFKDCGIDFETEIKRVDNEVDNFFLSLGYKHDRENHRFIEVEKNDKRIALFAHLGFGLEFLSSVLDIPYPTMSTCFSMGHSGVTAIQFKQKADGYVYPKILQLSNDSHLFKEDILSYEPGMEI